MVVMRHRVVELDIFWIANLNKVQKETNCVSSVKENPVGYKFSLSVVLEFNDLLKRWHFKFHVCECAIGRSKNEVFLSSYLRNQPTQDKSRHMIPWSSQAQMKMQGEGMKGIA